MIVFLDGAVFLTLLFSGDTDTEYSVQSSYDWYQTYASLRHLLHPDALTASTKLSTAFSSKRDCRILLLGCGNSTMCEDMIRDGWKGSITNLDFSPVALQALQHRLTNNDDETPSSSSSGNFCTRHGYDPNRLGFVCVDATVAPLPFGDESFDLIICKATLDAVLCSAGSTHKAKTMISECARLLQSQVGILFLVSYGNPDSRVEFLEYQNNLSHYWKVVSVETVARIPPSQHRQQQVKAGVTGQVYSQRGVPFHPGNHSKSGNHHHPTKGAKYVLECVTRWVGRCYTT